MILNIQAFLLAVFYPSVSDTSVFIDKEQYCKIQSSFSAFEDFYYSAEPQTKLNVLTYQMCAHACLSQSWLCYALNFNKERAGKRHSCLLFGVPDEESIIIKKGWIYASVVQDTSLGALPLLLQRFSYCNHPDGIYPSCSAALKSNKESPGTYQVFLFINNRNTIVSLYCFMKYGRATTSVGHNYQNKTKVTGGNEVAYSIKVNISYEYTDDLITAIVAKSKNCSQQFSVWCYHVRLTKYASWISHNGTQYFYFGDDQNEREGCDCWSTKTCHVSSMKCNCDTNDNAWRTDSGYFRDKSLLPVKQMRFGDMGDSSEKTFLALGKLECEL